MKLVDNVRQPFRGRKAMNFQISYSLSRFDNSGGGVAADARSLHPAATKTSLFRRWTTRT